MIFKTYDIKAIAVENDIPEVEVPCGSCAECCIKLTPILTPEEFQSGKYIYTLLNSPTNGIPTISIPKTEKGCLYFDGLQCTIYEDRPLACKQFDCRKKHYIPFADLVLEKFNIDIMKD